MEREEFGLEISFVFIFFSSNVINICFKFDYICFKFDSYLFHILFIIVASRAIWRMLRCRSNNGEGGVWPQSFIWFHICFKFDSYLFHIFIFTNVASRAIWRMQVKEWRGRSLASVTVVASSGRPASMGGGGLPISIFVFYLCHICLLFFGVCLILDLQWLLPVHYGFCPLVKFTNKDLAKLSGLAAIFKTKSYFR